MININFQKLNAIHHPVRVHFLGNDFSNCFLTVREDTLSDMVAHMTESVGLVHQMPFSCDRSGLPATLEKVCTYLYMLIYRIRMFTISK